MQGGNCLSSYYRGAGGLRLLEALIYSRVESQQSDSIREKAIVLCAAFVGVDFRTECQAIRRPRLDH